MGANKSQYQTDPWQPYIDKSAKDADVKQKAADDYAKVYGVGATETPPPDDPTPKMVNAPELAMAWTTAPDLVPTKPAPSDGQGQGSPPAGPDYTAFSVDLGAVRATEQSFLNATQTAQSAYENLKQQVTASYSSQTIFGQNAGQWQYAHGNNKGSLAWTPDNLAQGGVDMANSIIPAESHALQDVAGLIETVGMFTAMLNNTDQLYVEADAISYFPDDPSVEITAGFYNILTNPPPSNQ